MRLIQAGVGGFGSSWIYTARECEGFEHVALVDTNLGALRAAGEIAGVPPERQFTTVEEALSKVEADGFIDCTPAPCHHATTTTALRAGLHVLCEKPLADSMAAAQDMVRVADECHRVLMVTQQYRYYDQPRCIRNLLVEGHIGQLDHLVVEFQIQGLLFGWRQTMRHPFLLDMAIHHFDLMRYFLGCNAVRVQAMTWNPPVSNTRGDMCAFVWIEFENGVRVNYSGSFASPGCDTGWNGRWTFTGSRGSIVWNPRDDWGPIRLFRQNADLSQYTEQHFFTPLPELWGEPIWAPPIGAAGHHYDLYHWRACIEAGVEPETSGRDNLNTLALTFAAMQAADTGSVVEVRSIYQAETTPSMQT
ncbi:predicted dehydrogenase [Chthonomonas calidirosea]|uniref:Predicted dehydrogenases and related proteins n=1 Tax=Chthonomonas calidirosea (strain DSM 23976 / ICMP 18418 / T49) TaxID=1303518 RepID=S0EZR5_CHTCT|nr:Gfo/Idh/MocA family oxidoreductase [Chthonomonas calidirosea]CCW36009.1 Predicted dehydrogenases and related proteins [Chthonomonas calidirosea T49]CEK18599.1 predicted dehydrogenase [Chthonomonas calidirosea]